MNNHQSQTNKLCITGFNHKTSTVGEREQLQLSGMDIQSSLQSLKSIDGVLGIIIISTCNRLEFCFVIEESLEPFNILKEFYLEGFNIDLEQYKDIFYTHTGSAATSHLFRVISGMDSLVFGEYQVQNQVKDAYSAACAAKTADKTQHKLFHAAFRTGKKIRSATSLGSGKRSVSGAASKIFIESLDKSESIAIIGVNENTNIIASELQKAGFSSFVFVNRTLYKAEMMAEQYGGMAASLDKVEQALLDSDAVFTCTGASGFIISNEIIGRLRLQKQLPRLIIDMAVPRDVDSAFLPEGIDYYDIGNLQEFLGNEESHRLEDLPAAEKIIADETSIFDTWSSLAADEILEPYAEKFEMIRLQLMSESETHFSRSDLAKIDRMTSQLLHRLQSTFILILKNEAEKKLHPTPEVNE
jgi:glutamyl-tRNA reductase